MWSNVSLMPFFIATIVMSLYILIRTYNAQLIKLSNVDINKYQFPLLNKFHVISFMFPFKYFVEDDDKLTPKGEKLLRDLSVAGLSESFSPRSFMAMKVYLTIFSIILTVIISTLLSNSEILVSLLLGIEDTSFDILGYSDDYSLHVLGNSFSIFAFDLRVFIFMMILSLMPPLYLSSKIKKYETEYSRDLPVLQMFVILMLRSRKTTSEILLGLSKVDTAHKKAFKKAHRIYIRNQSEGLRYIKEYFEGNRFSETFALIEEMGEFAREDIVNIMNANLKNITDDVKLVVQSRAGVKLLYSQASMAFPFAGVIIFSAIPVVSYALSLMSMDF